MELSDWGDEDDLSDEEDHPLVALLESECSLKNEFEVGASDSLWLGVDLRLFAPLSIGHGRAGSPTRCDWGVILGRQTTG